ncbi:monosaccharide ABC transporter ATP-binding protein, CUT2 family [Tistlia consotensis]|uniref:Monosaccharide ABC transporter ATP-binding protein, CUT2 family n=1 Tax=Tistlia consotensis USBA 355 TaxID=560819 RepID=A0A1Y6CN22_9PROT|nr:sugar ABC transporter ATP-binding protein [Tistlia consotensis]SMF64488.1 monosaccharide ABC transporter ATP-binding protein, CUT2 family [Tistlia consotensis USBA 355]SNR97412.1 monosaccharide ABC transporter ATP-binding protein, CUT2 family [Tistlia consotensis]
MSEATQTAGGVVPPAVEGIRLAKAFGGVQAVDSATFSARPGEVHALVGENGAGKSTLIKLLGGRLRPDAGEVRAAGRKVELHGADDAHALGIWTVFQELTLLPWMTVAENLLIRREPRGRLGLIDRDRMVGEADRVLTWLGIDHIDPRALIEDLSLAQRQMVEIARVIIQDPSTLLLDEPTSSLGEKEVAWLFELIQGLRADGKCIIFTSHRWNEITSIADRITIFRNGAEVGTFTEIDEDRAVTLMTGRQLEAFYPQPPARAHDRAVLEVEELAGEGLRNASLTLHASEILGVGGLAGHGHRELFFSLFGAQAHSGRIVVDGRPARIRSPRDAARLGMALVPEDRKTEGLLLPLSVRANLTLAVLPAVSSLGLIGGARERGLAQGMVDALKIRTPGLGNPVRQLSGGNQQKVLLGRWLLADSRILLLYDVTRGVDVATKHEIYELMMRLAGEGRALLYYSSDAEELAHLCHRVLVMREGRIAAELSAPGITAEDIVTAAVRESRAAD